MRYVFKRTGIQYIDDVGRQLEKALRHCNIGSIATRRRYAAAFDRFIRVTVPVYKYKKIANIQDKHLVYYAEHLKSLGRDNHYIKVELAAIRFIHNLLPAKQELSPALEFNQALSLKNDKEYRERAWTENEYEQMVALAYEQGEEEIAGMMEVAWYTGCRLEEVVTLRRGDIELALRKGSLHLTNTKGGRSRDILLCEKAISILKRLIVGVPRGHYVFLPPGELMHSFKNAVEIWINRNRASIREERESEKAPLTYHGLRHAYGQRLYHELRGKDLSDYQARKVITERLGHGRTRVTQAYIPKGFC